MPVPGNYNDGGTVFRVDPTAMFEDATGDLRDEVRAIGEAVVSVSNIWKGIKLGWAGASAAEADEFHERLIGNLRQLFGTSDDDPGVAGKVVSGVRGAAINFGVAEDSVKRMFDSLTAGLGVSGSRDTPPTRGITDGPITDVTPSW